MFQESPDTDRIFVNPKIHIQKSPIHGYGVFSLDTIEKHEIVEIAAVVLFSRDTLDTLEKIGGGRHIIHDYVFTWIDGQMAFSMGYGGLYNHSWEHNAFWKLRTENEPALIFRASKMIEPGDEILIRYNPDWERLWFDTGIERHIDNTPPTFGESMASQYNDIKESVVSEDKLMSNAVDYITNKK